jgi:hypothetical protein
MGRVQDLRWVGRCCCVRGAGPPIATSHGTPPPRPQRPYERWPGDLFDRTYCSIPLFRLSSATSFFSRAFSSTPCFSSRTWSDSRLAYCFFHQRKVCSENAVLPGRGDTDVLNQRKVQAGRERRTLKILIDRYLVQYAGRHHSKRKLAETRRGLLIHMAPVHDLEVDKLTRRDLFEQVADLVVIRPDHPESCAWMVFKLFSWAMGWGLIEANPIVGTAHPSPEKTRSRRRRFNCCGVQWKKPLTMLRSSDFFS